MNRHVIGIDIGGTFADGVLLQDGRVIATRKTPTSTPMNEPIMKIIDGLTQSGTLNVDRLTLSTTIVTNMIATGRFATAGLIVFPGPGLEIPTDAFPFETIHCPGAVNFRGEVIEKLDSSSLDKAVRNLRDRGINKIAIVCKFSGRNPKIEEAAAAFIRDRFPSVQILEGYRIWPGLSFPRRCMATVLTLIIRENVKNFYDDLNQSMTRLGISCPVEILKADGGTAPVSHVLEEPLQAIFTGPAASAMGSIALTSTPDSAVFIDIGGTTSDIGLILNRKPLVAQRGVQVMDRALPIRSFSVVSVPLGGDSVLIHDDGYLQPQPYRKGSPACFGGDHATLTDAAVILGQMNRGDLSRARKSISGLLPGGTTIEKAARDALDIYNNRIRAAIERIGDSWKREPIYRIWELETRRFERPRDIIIVGAGAEPLKISLQDSTSGNIVLPRYFGVANAIGAAVARPSFTVTLHADSRTKQIVILEENIRMSMPSPMKKNRAENLAMKYAMQKAKQLHLDLLPDDLAMEYSEQFNSLRDDFRSDIITDVKVVCDAGIDPNWKGFIHDLS